MRIRWYGQSAFLLTGEQRTVLIDPFGAIAEQAKARGMVFDYPEIEPVEADVLLITHEHGDHNAADRATGDPATFRSTAGTFESPIGEIVGVASEHDDAAGTVRGPNTIFRFELDGLRFCHMGDFGQQALRPEQARAIGEIDVLFMPAGGGPTVGGEAAAQVVETLCPRLVFPMHYRTPAIGFLDPPDAFLESVGSPVEEVGDELDPGEWLGDFGMPAVVLAAAPLND
jgi:L-ascorbate metabolism protein UlaG (beta-lactamase superfamily)